MSKQQLTESQAYDLVSTFSERMYDLRNETSDHAFGEASGLISALVMAFRAFDMELSSEGVVDTYAFGGGDYTKEAFVLDFTESIMDLLFDANPTWSNPDVAAR